MLPRICPPVPHQGCFIQIGCCDFHIILLLISCTLKYISTLSIQLFRLCPFKRGISNWSLHQLLTIRSSKGCLTLGSIRTCVLYQCCQGNSSLYLLPPSCVLRGPLVVLVSSSYRVGDLSCYSFVVEFEPSSVCILSACFPFGLSPSKLRRFYLSSFFSSFLAPF